MHDKWKHGFVAALCVSATACQKDPPPAPTTSPETVTQSAKPVSPAEAKPTTTATSDGVNAASSPEALPQLQVGDPAPRLTLTLQDGKTVDLGSLKGKQVAVYFYPKDDTPGCTVEAQGIRDEWQAFEKAGVHVFGVSGQDASSHTAFIEKHKLPFDLVVDPDGAVAKAFGVPFSGGKAARQTFLIGADGKIKQVWRSVTPQAHAKELLDAAGVSSSPASTDKPKAG
jgi:peroxiredoxin Q/BCP